MPRALCGENVSPSRRADTLAERARVIPDASRGEGGEELAIRCFERARRFGLRPSQHPRRYQGIS